MDAPGPTKGPKTTRVIQSLRFSADQVEIQYIEKDDIRQQGRSYLVHAIHITRTAYPDAVTRFQTETDLLLTEALQNWVDSQPTIHVPDSAPELRAALRYRTIVRPALTPREEEVLALLVEGQSAAAIAKKLFISPSTTKSHIAMIYRKFGTNNRASATVAAVRLGFVALE